MAALGKIRKRGVALVIIIGLGLFAFIAEEAFRSCEATKNQQRQQVGEVLGNKINELFDLELPESDEYMTLGGLILHKYQSFPKLNEAVRIDGFEFKIIKNTATKIELVRLKVV